MVDLRDKKKRLGPLFLSRKSVVCTERELLTGTIREGQLAPLLLFWQLFLSYLKIGFSICYRAANIAPPPSNTTRKRIRQSSPKKARIPPMQPKPCF